MAEHALRHRGTPSFRAVILDVDGTLVDSTYHHALAWYDAVRAAGEDIPVWRLHRLVGMGGDRFVEAAGGPVLERRAGDRLRALHAEAFARHLPHIRPLPGAAGFVRSLRARDLEVVLASSAPRDELRAHVARLGVADLLRATVSAEDVDASKPAPDVLGVAMDRLGHRAALAVGDAAWDMRAARAAGIPAAGLLTGGVSREELTAAGAVHVAEDLAALTVWLDGLDAPSGQGPGETAALGRLQGRVAARPEVVDDEAGFAALVRSVVDETVPAGEDRARTERRLRAMRDQLREAGS